MIDTRSSYAQEFIANPIVAYTPRVLSGLAVAVSLFALAVLICSASPASAYTTAACLSVAYYSGITVAATVALGLLRDGANAILTTLEKESWGEGFREFYTNAAITVISPVIAGGIAAWAFIAH
jgi:hypothetical protein